MAPGRIFHGRFVADEPAPRRVVVVREQGLHGHVDKIRVSVEGLAVGKGELGALDHGVDELRAQWVHGRHVEALEQGELLQKHRPLRPRTALAERVVAVVVAHRVFVSGAPRRHVGARQHAPVAPPAGVHDLGLTAEAIDRVRDETPVPRLARRLDLAVAIPLAAGLGLGEQAPPRRRQGLVGVEGADGRHVAAAQVQVGRCRPLVHEQIAHHGYGCVHALDHRDAGLGVVDGALEDVVEAQGAVVAQQHHPAVEGARHHGGQQPGRRHQVEAEAPVVVDGGAGRRRALGAHHTGLGPVGPVVEDRQVTARPVEVGLRHLQSQAGGDHRVEGVAAGLQHGHARRRGQPVGGGDGAKGAGQLRAGGEHGLRIYQLAWT